jgi:hypothetical protein
MAMARNRNSDSVTLGGVAVRFRQWRKRRQGKAAIPDELWAAAAAVARRDGVNRTATALHLDGAKLKRRMRSSDSVSSQAMRPAFVELMAPGTLHSGLGLPEYTIELEGRQGKLRIHCKGTTATDMAALSRALWEVAC